MQAKVYIYGALTIVFLFQANLLAGGNVGVWTAIACAGSSYFASLAEWAFYERLCWFLWGTAFVLGALSFLSLFA